LVSVIYDQWGVGVWQSAPDTSDLLNGVPPEQLCPRAAAIVRQIERHREREPGEDNE